MFSMFQEENGMCSMRRILAFFLTIAGVVSGIISIFCRLDWQVIAVSFGIPLLAAIFLLFFTTWTDVSEIVSKFKKA